LSESPFRLGDRVRSFGPALRGIVEMLRSEHNARIHALATIVVVAAGLGFGIERGEWLAIALAVSLVWMAEAFNSALEALGDAVSSELHPLIGRAKDAAAGAVLLAAIGSVVVAALVFGPRLL
jgi:diacylglycerol kinase (ATP)